MTTPGAPRGPVLMGRMFLGMGIAHFVVPGEFAKSIPPRLPAKRGLVYASGVAELACGYGLLRKEPWAGPASAVLLASVFPANVQMAVDARRDLRETPSAANRLKLAALLARLPFQLPMVWAVLQAKKAP